MGLGGWSAQGGAAAAAGGAAAAAGSACSGFCAARSTRSAAAAGGRCHLHLDRRGGCRAPRSARQLRSFVTAAISAFIVVVGVSLWPVIWVWCWAGCWPPRSRRCGAAAARPAVMALWGAVVSMLALRNLLAALKAGGGYNTLALGLRRPPRRAGSSGEQRVSEEAEMSGCGSALERLRPDRHHQATAASIFCSGRFWRVEVAPPVRLPTTSPRTTPEPGRRRAGAAGAHRGASLLIADEMFCVLCGIRVWARPRAGLCDTQAFGRGA